MNEADFMRRLQLEASEAGDRLFRNNVGVGWVGQTTTRRERDGSTTAIIRNARPLHAGLAVGSGDLIGWTRRLIGGEQVAVFTSREVKSATGRTSDAQKAWRDVVNQAGGYADVRRDSGPGTT